jgi:prophage DNA circulation protein
MDNKPGDSRGTILVEFEEVGLAEVSTETELAEKSVRAINKAMETIRDMAQRVSDTVQDLPG